MKISTKAKYALLLAIFSIGSFTIVGCESNDGPMEEAGEKVDEAADDVKDAADDIGDGIEDAADEMTE